MTGHCDFCGIWHSGPCCHPGRAKLVELVELESQLTAANAKVEKLQEACEVAKANLNPLTSNAWTILQKALTDTEEK